MSPQALDRDAATLTSKGQITIPKHIRDRLHLKPGSKLQFVPLHNGHVELVPKTATVDDLVGFLHDPNREPLTIEELKEAAADGWAFGDPDSEEPWSLPEWNQR